MSQSGVYGFGGGGGGAVLTLTGNAGGAVSPSGGNINVVGSGTVVVTGNPGTHTLTISDTGGSASTYDGDTGSAMPAGNTINIIAGVASLNCGQTVEFSAATNIVELNVTDGSDNTIIGKGSGKTGATAADCTGLGSQVLTALTTGDANTSVGAFSLFKVTTGASNTAVGALALDNLVTGSSNIAIGDLAGSNYTTTESNNISIGNSGVIADSATIRIGTHGTQTSTFIAGIDAVNVGSVATVVTEAGDKLGTAVITAGTNVTVTPGANTITIAAGTSSQVVHYTSVNNAASPYTVLSTDYYIGVDSSGGPVTINLPNAPTTGRIFVIKDKAGTSATNNITISTLGGVVTIDGSTSFVMNTAYESINLLFNGTSYEVY